MTRRSTDTEGTPPARNGEESPALARPSSIDISLTSAQTTALERARTERGVALKLTEVVGARLGGEANVVRNLTANKPDGYARVWQIEVSGEQIAVKFAFARHGESLDAATNELAIDRETLRQKFHQMVPYLGSISDAQGVIVAVLTKYDASPSIYDRMKEGSLTPVDAKLKLVELILALQSKGFHVVDENPDNFRVRPDGTIFCIDGAAVSRRDRMGRIAGGGTPAPFPIAGSIAEGSGFEGLFGHSGDDFSDASFDVDAPEGDSSPSTLGASPDFLTPEQIADLVLAKIKEVSPELFQRGSKKGSTPPKKGH
ncbi:MAG: hypothetical protein K1X79_10980 [Oligoflexia bacterium]|nr:hypothetical protein [Oligoflexia bacterium]